MGMPRHGHGLLTVGEFSTLGRITVKALYVYDRLGLLRPRSVDPSSGYRLYGLNQLARLNRVLALKDLGFSLREVADLLEEDLPPAEMRGMLHLKQAEAEREISEARSRLARVAARLEQIEREDGAPVPNGEEVALKELAPTTVASVRATEPTPASLGRRIEEVVFLAAESGFATGGPPFVLFHHEGFRERDLDAEICAPVTPGAILNVSVFGGGRLRIRELAGSPTAAGIVYQGPYGALVGSYAALGNWIVANGYKATGLARETYLRGGEDPVTEIQYPVEQA